MINRVVQRLRGRATPPLGRLKLRAIDAAYEACGFETIADLGAVWAVDGGYALYALDRYGASRATICDFEFTKPLLARAEEDPRIQLIAGDFGTQAVAERVGEVDAILMFDVLLHQFAPDWDEVMRMYAPRCRCIVLAGPWWNGPKSVRLLELGRERYLDLVPERDFHEAALARLDEEAVGRGRKWRDCQDIWQWGITGHDLEAVADSLGFRLAHHEYAGGWQRSERFDDRSFVFVRKGA